MEFNEKLQQLRTGKNLTQEQLAEQLYVSRTAISKWESGKGYPNIESLKCISKSSDYPANALKYRQIRGIAGRIYYQFTTNGQSRDMRPQSRG